MGRFRRRTSQIVSKGTKRLIVFPFRSLSSPHLPHLRYPHTLIDIALSQFNHIDHLTSFLSHRLSLSLCASIFYFLCSSYRSSLPLSSHHQRLNLMNRMVSRELSIPLSSEVCWIFKWCTRLLSHDLCMAFTGTLSPCVLCCPNPTNLSVRRLRYITILLGESLLTI